MQKFSLHISEDNFNHVIVVKKLAIPNGELLPENERELAIDKWFDFEWFKHPGEAIEWYEKNNLEIAPLHIADIDFTELDTDPTVSSAYKSNVSGIITIKYLLDKFLSRCQIIPYSNKLDDEDIVAALADMGWDNETVAKIIDQLNEKFIKTQQPLLKRRIEDKLKIMAKQQFLLLDKGARHNLSLEINKGAYADWSNYIVHFENYDFLLSNALAGWGDITLMDKASVSNVVENLLAETEVDTEFLGWWSTGSGNNIPHYLDWYWESKDYLKKKLAINLRAIDLILDIMHVKKYYEENPSTIFLAENNKLYKISEKVKGITSQRRFDDKLVARRAVIACTNMFNKNEQTFFDLPVLCSLICYHQTEKPVTDKKTGEEKGRADSWISTAFRDYFGLKREDKKVPLEIGKIMGEEYNFYNAYIKNGVIEEIRNFLDEFDFSLNFSATDKFRKQCEKEFNDLAHFSKFVFKVQSKYPNLVDTLISQVKEYVNDEAYKLISKSIPLFH